MDEEFFLTGLINYLSSARFIVSCIVVAIAILLWFILRSIYKKINSKLGDTASDPKRTLFLSYSKTILKLLLFILTALTVLQINGINVGSMLAGLGIASAISGLALQDILKDVIMGVRLISDKFFTVGDIVNYNGVEGVVEDFNVRVTRLKLTANGNYMTICNRNISEISIVSNWSDVDVALSYDDDPAKVHAVLGKIAKKAKSIPDVEDCIYKGTERFDKSAIIYKIRLYCPADKRFDARRACVRLLQEEIPKNGLTVPYEHIQILGNLESKENTQ